MDTETIIKHFQAGTPDNISLDRRPGWRPAKIPCGECLETILRQVKAPLDGQVTSCVGCDNTLVAVGRAEAVPVSRWALARCDEVVKRDPTAVLARSSRGDSVDLSLVFTSGRSGAHYSWSGAVKRLASNPLLVRLDERAILVYDEAVSS